MYKPNPQRYDAMLYNRWQKRIEAAGRLPRVVAEFRGPDIFGECKEDVAYGIRPRYNPL